MENMVKSCLYLIMNRQRKLQQRQFVAEGSRAQTATIDEQDIHGHFHFIEFTKRCTPFTTFAWSATNVSCTGAHVHFFNWIDHCRGHTGHRIKKTMFFFGSDDWKTSQEKHREEV